MKIWILLLVTMFVLSGCQLTRVEGEVEDVEVSISKKGEADDDDDSQGKFCPPGQAKKGRC